MSLLGVIYKQPSERLTFDVSYDYVLDGRPGTVSSPVVTAPAGLTVSASVIGTRVRLTIEGGTDGQQYGLTVTALVTADSATDTIEDELTVSVSEQVAPSLEQPFLAPPIPLEQALPRVLPYANGCPDVTALFHLRQAAITFCQKTLAWQQEITATTAADQTSYRLLIPAGAAIAKLLSYHLDGKEFDVVSASKGRQLQVHQSSADAAWSVDRSAIVVTPTPAEAGKVINVSVALKPTQDATVLPGDVWEHYIEHIAAGALGGILDLPNQPWTDPSRAAMKREEFKDAIATVGAAISRGYGRTNQRVRGHFF